ncbi:putative transmembrane protein [Senna tora]|uniref:Putative transmembrane protein n=1 Tax=Senna tora TaxID=362788 RepID=A0A834W568_9FABA|nr:putative transmembrane protein [Senna tora]
MPIRMLIEVEPPSPLRYLTGAAVMMIGVVLPVGYMMFRNKRVPSSSSSYSKQTDKVLI